jgi:hypothetical protein
MSIVDGATERYRPFNYTGEASLAPPGCLSIGGLHDASNALEHLDAGITRGSQFGAFARHNEYYLGMFYYMACLSDHTRERLSRAAFIRERERGGEREGGGVFRSTANILASSNGLPNGALVPYN